jgi:hypothetical protein
MKEKETKIVLPKNIHFLFNIIISFITEENCLSMKTVKDHNYFINSVECLKCIQILTMYSVTLDCSEEKAF